MYLTPEKQTPPAFGHLPLKKGEELFLVKLIVKSYVLEECGEFLEF